MSRTTLTLLACACGIVPSLALDVPLPKPTDSFRDPNIPDLGFLPNIADGAVSFTTLSATREPGEPVHALRPGGSSVWWKMTAPSNGLIILSVGDCDFDSTLAVYSGAAGPIQLHLLADTVFDTEVLASATHDPSAALWQRRAKKPSLSQFIKKSLNVIAGNTYWICVDGHGSQARGRATLKLEPIWFDIPGMSIPSSTSLAEGAAANLTATFPAWNKPWTLQVAIYGSSGKVVAPTTVAVPAGATSVTIPMSTQANGLVGEAAASFSWRIFTLDAPWEDSNDGTITVLDGPAPAAIPMHLVHAESAREAYGAKVRFFVAPAMPSSRPCVATISVRKEVVGQADVITQHTVTVAAAASGAWLEIPAATTGSADARYTATITTITGQGFSIGTATAQAMLLDASLPLTASLSQSAIPAEGDFGARTILPATLSLSRALPIPFTITISGSLGTTNITVPAGTATLPITTLAATGDEIVQGGMRTFAISITSSLLAQQANATLKVADDDSTAVVLDDGMSTRYNSTSTSVGDGESLAYFRVFLKKPRATAATISVATYALGDADAATIGTLATADLQQQTIAVTIPALSRMGTGYIQLKDNTLLERDKRFGIKVVNSGGLAIARATGTVVVLDNDGTSASLTPTISMTGTGVVSTGSKTWSMETGATTFTLPGSVSCPDRGTLGLMSPWRIISSDGGFPMIQDASKANSQVTVPGPGTYVFRLYGLRWQGYATGTVTVTVLPSGNG